jgi:hypothetical protein
MGCKDKKKKRGLYKLENLIGDEVSIVPSGANLLSGFDIVKSEELITESITKKDIEEYYDYLLNDQLWRAYCYACQDAMCSIQFSEKSKQEKIEELARLFTIFLNDLQNNPLVKIAEDGSLIVKSKKEVVIDSIKELPEGKEKTQEKIMSKESKVSELQKLLDSVISMFKKDVEEIVEDIVVEPEVIVEEPVVEVEPVVEIAVEEVIIEPIVEEIGKTIEESSVEIVELEKAKNEVAELKKQLEKLEKEKIEQVKKAQKEELIVKVKKELAFMSGSPDENVEKLLDVKKQVSEETFEWIYKNLKKESEIIEKELEEKGIAFADAEDMTAEDKLVKIAKSIEVEEKITYEKAYRKAGEANPDLLKQAIYKNK